MQIVQTQDYDLFKRLPGNRQLYKNHLTHLKDSIERENLAQYQPILVNEHYEVIDGQHRLEALRELERPVYYIQAEGLKLPEVQTLNTLSKTWSPIDYAKSYIELGRDEYRQYLELKSTYRLPHNVLLHYIYLSQNKTQNKDFKEGRLQVKNLRLTKLYLDQLLEVGAYFSRYSKAAFAGAFLKIAQHPEYDHNRMIAKMRVRGHLIEDFSNTEDFQRALEATYNHHMRKDRVRFF